MREEHQFFICSFAYSYLLRTAATAQRAQDFPHLPTFTLASLLIDIQLPCTVISLPRACSVSPICLPCPHVDAWQPQSYDNNNAVVEGHVAIIGAADTALTATKSRRWMKKRCGASALPPRQRASNMRPSPASLHPCAKSRWARLKKENRRKNLSHACAACTREGNGDAMSRFLMMPQPALVSD